jgi:hydrogenase/urease accessory protein HupE
VSPCIARAVAWSVVVLTIAFAWTKPGLSHEVRPAFLQIAEQANGHYDVLWKQPSMGILAVHLVPHISGGFLEHRPSAIESASTFELHIWRNLDPGPSGLEGRTLTIDGLDRTITDVLVSITLADDRSFQEILRPGSPGLVLRLRQSGAEVSAYLGMGVEHILTGADHLSFILCLLLLVRPWMNLIKAVTAFTVAHSITLAATALHVITVRPSLIEALVALSILFVAVELVHGLRGRIGLTARYPWLIAFIFGLLHGSAFAGALAQIGLPPHAIPFSLLMFNIGVEIGQLLFIGVAIFIGWALLRLFKEFPAWTRWVLPYAIGSLSAFWFIGRLQTALS